MLNVYFVVVCESSFFNKNIYHANQENELHKNIYRTNKVICFQIFVNNNPIVMTLLAIHTGKT